MAMKFSSSGGSFSSFEKYDFAVFWHKTADSGNKMTKRFCPNCGTLLFGNSSGRQNSVSIRAGTIDQFDLIKPQMNVFVAKKIESTPIDKSLPCSDAMPSGQPWKK